LADQEYEDAPLAVSVVEVPWQIVRLALVVTLIPAFTVNEVVTVSLHEVEGLKITAVKL
jgi:hypothetical protein